MATLIPSFGNCISRMTSGERRLAERLEQKLDDDYVLWYDVPVGLKQGRPDFVLMHPRRGLLILEVKDWKSETIVRADKESWVILENSHSKTVINPMEQARQYSHQVVDALKRDPALVQIEGQQQGNLIFPWSYGVVFPNLTHQQFIDKALGQVLEPHRVLCRDGMMESITAEDWESQLRRLLPCMPHCDLSLEQFNRVRWILFPEVRIQAETALFNDNNPQAKLPDIMRVMDLQQEQFARSLGDGHRVIYGVTGSGKTMILGYRAEYLAQAHTPASKPILILCYNESLAVKLASVMQSKGLADRVQACHFHKWCRDQLLAFGQTLPPHHLPVATRMDEIVQRVISAVERQEIPVGQYQAVLIDEGHKFAPEWLRLVTQMVDPTTNSLLLVYDDPEIIDKRHPAKQFCFGSVGIQAMGRTSFLKISERRKLLASIATTIKTYRQGELLEPTPEHVDRWASQFSATDQVPFLREFDHVIKQTFITKKEVEIFLEYLVKNQKFVGANPAAFWKKANFLQIQKAGQSQKEMISLFGKSLNHQCGLDIAQCGSAGGSYIYLDDVLFTGGRIASDLEAWIATKAPDKAVVHVILMALHTSGHYYIKNNRLRKANAASGKNIEINFWRLFEFENQKHNRNNSLVLWPTTVPDNEKVQAYISSEKQFPLVLRQPGGTPGVFSSEAGRQLLEREFLVAGVKIRALTKTPKDFVRPLGNGSFGVGFGTLIATYRNCPNNCPLAIWWGDPDATSGALHWYPLLARKTYGTQGNEIDDFAHFAG